MGLFASLRTLVRYGLGMTGNGDEAGQGADWLDEVFDRLKALTDQAIAVVAAAPATAPGVGVSCWRGPG